MTRFSFSQCEKWSIAKLSVGLEVPHIVFAQLLFFEHFQSMWTVLCYSYCIRQGLHLRPDWMRDSFKLKSKAVFHCVSTFFHIQNQCILHLYKMWEVKMAGFKIRCGQCIVCMANQEGRIQISLILRAFWLCRN